MKKTIMLTAFTIYACVLTAQSSKYRIGAPDGVSYYVIDVRKTLKFSSGYCGYNDFSIPNSAEFRIETRKYSRYFRGRLIESWVKKVEIFERCISI